MGQLCPFVSFCAVLLSIKQKSKVSIQYNKIPLVKKDDDSIRTYIKRVRHRLMTHPPANILRHKIQVITLLYIFVRCKILGVSVLTF